ncbi:hypothetical protein [Pseudomonas putida]
MRRLRDLLLDAVATSPDCPLLADSVEKVGFEFRGKKCAPEIEI